MGLRRLSSWWLLLGMVGFVSWGWRDRAASEYAQHEAIGSSAATLSSDDGDPHRDPFTLVVDYRDDVPADLLAHDAFDEQPVSHQTDVDRIYRLHFSSAEQAAQAKAKLAPSPWVESVDFDTTWQLDASENAESEADELAAAPSLAEVCERAADEKHVGFPSDPCFSYQWHLRQVGLPAAWKQGQGEGAIVAVIDTGVARVADLADTKFVPGYNFVADTEDATDDHGHGTHVAGTIAQATNNGRGVAGVAWRASIMPLKVLSARGSGSMAAIAQAIRFAADHGANVINMSLGGPFPVGAIGNAVRYARQKGVIVVAAAGNDGKGKVSYPARYAGVLAVAATDLGEAPTFYSNWGKQIDIAAPGGDTRTDKNGDGQPDGVLQNTVVPGATHRQDYLWFMGTSMATPHVAGVAALVVGAGVRDPDAVESILLGTARSPVGQKEARGQRIDDHYGGGIVDAGAALGKARSGRGASELGLGTALAMVGVSLARRRGRGTEKLSPLFAAAVGLGSAGLFFLSWVLPSHGPLEVLSHNPLTALDAHLPFVAGNPLLWSALLPIGAIALLQGIRKLRAPLAGLAFGIAGALTFAALAHPIDIHWLPGARLDTLWLLANAALATTAGALTLRKG